MDANAGDSLATLARRLRTEAQRTNQRRLLVLAGDRSAGLDAAVDALAAAGIDDGAAAAVTDDADDVRTRAFEAGCGGDVECVPPPNADRLLGTTRDAVVVDAHGRAEPNVFGRVVGAVAGGGLFVLVTPSLDTWPSRRDAFDERLAVPPFGVDDVAGRFRRRLVGTLRTHPGVAVVDVDEGRIERDGLTGESTPPTGEGPTVPRDHAFPRGAYEACLTGDQSRAVAALERLREAGRAVVVEADRGRGKSSAAGIAAACLAAEGRDVLVTGPGYRSTNEVFTRAVAVLSSLGEAATHDETAHRIDVANSGGRIRFSPAPEAADLPEDPDAVVVDEAAALPVRLLTAVLDAPAVAFCTTVHGYEGAGRGFSVRFRDRLDASDHDVTDVRMDEPIRYARGDPVESWAFRALLLDARPPVDPLVEDATPASVTYRTLTPEALLADEHLLREAFGLLVLAHYRTEPNDLARLLDAPNLSVRALCHEGHVVSVALLAREGGLDADTREHMYFGGRVRGNMLPDVLTSQLRDETAAVPVGYRVMRIATHHAVRSRGLGSRLLSRLEAEFDGEADWLGVGYGATPALLSFWAANGYRTVHLSTTRNDASGEYSALMLRPLSESGTALCTRHESWFAGRIAGVLGDALRDVDADVVRAALRACDAAPELALSDHEWRVVVGASYGPGLYDVAPDAFVDLTVTGLNEGCDALSAREERLLVRKVLQRWRWTDVADALGYVSTGQCMRAFGEAVQPLVDAYGTALAHEERARYVDEGGD